jgi:hypothetical protein
MKTRENAKMKKYFVLLMVVLMRPAEATQYWIHPTLGNDANICANTSTAEGATNPPSQFRKSFQGGYACLSPGDILHARAGVYSTTLDRLNGPREVNGTVSDYTIIEGEDVNGFGGTVITQGWYFGGTSIRHYLLLRNFTATAGIGPGNSRTTCHDIIVNHVKVSNPNEQAIHSGCNNLTVRNSEIFNAGVPGSNQAHGIYAQGQDNLFENNYIHDIVGSGYAIQCDLTSSSDTDRCTIRNNLIERTFHGINFDGADPKAYGNIFRGGTVINGGLGHAIDCGYAYTDANGSSPGCQRPLIANNIFTGYSVGIYLGMFGNVDGAIIRNNIFFNSGGTNTITSDPNHLITNLIADHNACGPNDNCGSSRQIITALADCLTSDFHQKIGSLCIDKGVNVGLPFVGSAPDIGAYEFLSGSSRPLPPQNLKAQ